MSTSTLSTPCLTTMRAPDELGTKDAFGDLVTLARQRALTNGAQTAYTYGHGEDPVHWTYADLDRQARSIAAQLQALGCVGQRALMLYPSGPDFLAGFFGCLYAGVIAVPAYPPRLPPRVRDTTWRRLLAVVRDASPSVVLTTQHIKTRMARVTSALPDLAFASWLATDTHDGPGPEAWTPFTPEPSSLALLQYTSGSTDHAKGVMVSHGNLLANERMIVSALRLTESSVGGGWLPLFHDMGLIGQVLGSLFAGCPCHLMEPMAFAKKPLSWLRLISRYRITHSTAPDFAYRLCADTISDADKASLDLSCWQLALSGAEPVRAETIERFSEAFASCGFSRRAFYPSYGLAEATLFVSGAHQQTESVRMRALRSALQDDLLVEAAPDAAETDVRVLVGCGEGAPEQRLEIVDPTTRMALPDGKVGEIWVAGPHVAAGYWNHLALSAERFNVALAGSAEGVFLRTGDLGVLSEGRLFITGRLSDLIVVRGVNHHPEDIERSIAYVDPRFQGSCVVSVDIGHQERVVVLQEVRRDFLLADTESTGEMVREVLAQHHGLELHACVLVKAGSLPRTSSGKVQRLTCRARFLAGELNVLGTWTRPIPNGGMLLSDGTSRSNDDAGQLSAGEIQGWLQQRVGKLLGMEVHEVDAQKNLAEYGLDSAASVMIAGELEQWLHAEVPDTLSWDYPTIAAIAEFLAQRPSPVRHTRARETAYLGAEA